MSDLKPCPICGEQPFLGHEENGLYGSSILYYVVCPSCGIRTQKDRTVGTVIKTWNRRDGKNERSD